MKKLILSLFCLLTVGVTTLHAAVGDRHIEQAGGFSFQPPHQWQFREFPGMKYQIAFGVPENSFAPNINVVDEAYSGSVHSYVDANLQAIEKMFEQFSLIKRSSFVTKSGIKGEMIVATSIQQKNLLRQTFYMLPGKTGKYYVVTCSTLANGGEKLDAIFEESVKTFALTE